MLLKSMLLDMPHELLCGDIEKTITGVQQDSRKVVMNTLFIAVKGFKVDGHNYINKAVDMGATAVVVTEYSKSLIAELEDKNVTLILCTDDRAAMSYLSAYFYGRPSEKLKMIGLTGTNGKTSTCRILTDMLIASGISTGLLGTIANEIGGKTYKASLTTPEPIELHGLLSTMVEDGIEACVMEASSHALDLKRVEDVDYDYSVFTNLTEDHLDYHENFEDYFRAKTKLFDMTSKGRLINVDDPYGKRLFDQYNEKSLVTQTSAQEKVETISYGLNSDAMLRAKNIEYTEAGSRYTLATPNGEVNVEVPLPGRIYVYNTLAAFGVLYMMGKTLGEIAKCALAITPVPGRMEQVKHESQIKVFVDYAHTPDALSNAIDIVKSMTKNKVITVFGCGGDRDAMKRPQMGQIAEEKSDQIIVTSDNPRTEDPLKIIKNITQGLNYPENAIIEPDRKSAIGKAISVATKGDIVLIAGKGHETYQEINGIRYEFDDREIALGYLNVEENND